MTPRDRVMAALSGQELYPVPYDVYENGVHPVLHAKLVEHYGLAEDDIEGLMKAMGACVRWTRPLYIGPPFEEGNFGTPVYPAKKILKDIWGTWGESVATYTDTVPRPLSSAETVADIEAHPWPNPDWFDYERVGWFTDTPETHLPIAEWAKRNSDYARLGGGWSPVFSRAMDMFGMERGLTHVADRPELIEATMAHIAGFFEEYYRRLARAGRGHFDILAWGDDFASQQAMMLRPELWRKWLLPIWKRLFAIAHENGMKAAFHSCGSVHAVLGDLVDAGLDIFENVQVKARDMDPKDLKREFGKHLAFYGGMDIQEIMPKSSPDEVRREVRRLIDILGKGGRYVLCTGHFLMDDVPLDNALAMYDEARRYRC